jgi:hypothetical protein
MDITLAITLGSIFTFIIAFIEYVKLFQLKKKLEMIDWLLIAIALFNGVGFSFVFWATYSGYNIDIWASKIFMYSRESILIYYALNLIMVFSIIIGWIIAKDILLIKKRGLEKPNLNYVKKYTLKTYKVAWLMLILSVILYALYSCAYGGFTGLILNSRLIRSGITVVENSFSFLQRFGSFAFFSSYLFLGLIIDKTLDFSKRKSLFFGFVLSFGFSIFVLYTWVGRISFIVYFSTLVMGIILFRNTSIIRLSRKLVNLALLSFASIILFDRLLNRSRVGISSIELFTKELSFPVASFITQLEINSLRWFKDLFVFPLYILPSRIWNVMLGIESASMENTYAFWGAVKGQSGVTASIPVDMLTFSYMQASVLGVLLTGIIWGFLIVILQNMVNKIPIRGIRMVLLGNVILNVVVLSVLYGDPLHIITRNFGLISGVLVLALVNKIKVKRSRYNTSKFRIIYTNITLLVVCFLK